MTVSNQNLHNVISYLIFRRVKCHVLFIILKEWLYCLFITSN